VVVVTTLDPGPQVTAPTAGDDAGDERSTRSRRRPGWRWPVAALAVAVGVGAAGLGVARLAGGDPPPPTMGPGDVTVEIDVEHSLYATTELRVVEGTRVRFVVVNGDPIAHELIVGPPDVHARHASGTEAEHPSIPGEVSVGAGLTAVTTFTFDEPGTFEFACHLPGHYEYGMHGEVEVVPA
jgi:plastocyanin